MLYKARMSIERYPLALEGIADLRRLNGETYRDRVRECDNQRDEERECNRERESKRERHKI